MRQLGRRPQATTGSEGYGRAKAIVTLCAVVITLALAQDANAQLLPWLVDGGAEVSVCNPSAPFGVEVKSDRRTLPPDGAGRAVAVQVNLANGSSASAATNVDLSAGRHSISIQAAWDGDPAGCAGASGASPSDTYDHLTLNAAATTTIRFAFSGSYSFNGAIRPDNPCPSPPCTGSTYHSLFIGGAPQMSLGGDAEMLNGVPTLTFFNGSASKSGTVDVAFSEQLALLVESFVNPTGAAAGGRSVFSSSSASVDATFRLLLPAGVTCTSASGVFPGCDSPAPPPPPPPDQDVDLSIGPGADAVRVVQVVFNSDINKDGVVDLVANKPAVVLVKVKATSVKPDDTRTFNVRAQIGAQEAFSDDVALTDIPADGKDIEVYFTPTATGQVTVEVKVDAEDTIAEKQEDNNSNSSQLDVKRTRDLRIAYLRVEDCLPLGGCYGPLLDVSATVNGFNEFNSATFPVANYVGTLLPQSYRGGAILGLLDDILSVATWGRLFDPSSDRTIGIVPRDYFVFHLQPQTKGISLWPFPGGLVTEGALTASAHELGHTFGISEEEYDTYPPYGGLANGFWVSRKARVDNSICFMGTNDIGPIARWIDNRHYEHLFRNRLVVPDDPQVMLVAGVIHRDGRVDLRPTYFLPNGLATESQAGDYGVRVIDGRGQTLTEIAMPVEFIMHVDPGGIQEVDAVPFLVTIPYPDTAAKIEIVGPQGVVLAKISASTQVLIDAIKAVPDFGFRDLPSQRRRALLDKAIGIDRAVAAGGTRGAVQNLVYDFRQNVWAWLSDGYSKTEPVQLQKEEVLALIDAMAIRLANLGK
jgi:hypothetical protein